MKSRDITREGQVTIRRWYLTPGSWPVRAFIHKIFRRDPDPVHNHPWRWAISVVLRGFYVEILNGERKRRFAPSIHFYTHNDFHRIVGVDPVRGCWTLFIVGPKTGQWEFEDGRVITEKLRDRLDV